MSFFCLPLLAWYSRLPQTETAMRIVTAMDVPYAIGHYPSAISGRRSQLQRDLHAFAGSQRGPSVGSIIDQIGNLSLQEVGD